MKRICSLALILTLLLAMIPGAAAAPEQPKLTSAAAYVMDYDTGSILYAKNETTLRAPASTTKLLTAYLVFDAMAAGWFSEDTLVPVSEAAYAVANDWELTNVVMEQGDSYTVRDLMSAMLVVSACGVCVSLAELVSGSEEAFVRQMNNKLWELGIEGYFVDSYGLSSENQISAQGLALLSQALIQDYPQVLDYTKQTEILFDGRRYGCTNCLLPGCSAEYEGADGLKTGSTTAAGKCLVGTAKQNGRRIIAVLLGAPYNSTRATEMVALLDYGFARLAELPVAPEAPTVPSEPSAPTQPDQEMPFPPEAVTDDADAAMRLYNLGLLRGQGTLANGSPDLALNDQLTRAQAVVLLLRLLGLEQEAFTTGTDCPFTDVPGWAEPYIALAWEKGLVAGVNEAGTLFDPDAPCDVRSYLTFLLRALGYVEKIDFYWDAALAYALQIGLDEATGLHSTGKIDRGIAARLAFGVLTCWTADGSQYLCDALVANGTLDAETAAQQGLPVNGWFFGVGDAA